MQLGEGNLGSLQVVKVFILSHWSLMCHFRLRLLVRNVLF